jgi:hypothetical protein
MASSMNKDVNWLTHGYTYAHGVRREVEFVDLAIQHGISHPLHGINGSTVQYLELFSPAFDRINEDCIRSILL